MLDASAFIKLLLKIANWRKSAITLIIRPEASPMGPRQVNE